MIKTEPSYKLWTMLTWLPNQPMYLIRPLLICVSARTRCRLQHLGFIGTQFRLYPHTPNPERIWIESRSTAHINASFCGHLLALFPVKIACFSNGGKSRKGATVDVIWQCVEDGAVCLRWIRSRVENSSLVERKGQLVAWERGWTRISSNPKEFPPWMANLSIYFTHRPWALSCTLSQSFISLMFFPSTHQNTYVHRILLFFFLKHDNCAKERPRRQNYEWKPRLICLPLVAVEFQLRLKKITMIIL